MFVLVVVSSKIVPPIVGPNKGRQLVIVSWVVTVLVYCALSVNDHNYNFSTVDPVNIKLLFIHFCCVESYDRT